MPKKRARTRLRGNMNPSVNQSDATQHAHSELSLSSQHRFQYRSCHMGRPPMCQCVGRTQILHMLPRGAPLVPVPYYDAQNHAVKRFEDTTPHQKG